MFSSRSIKLKNPGQKVCFIRLNIISLIQLKTELKFSVSNRIMISLQ